MRAEAHAVAIGPGRAGVLFQREIQDFQIGRLDQIVRVQRNDNARARVLYPRVAGGGQAVQEGA